MAESDVPADVYALTSDLIARKAHTRELGAEPLSAVIRDFVDGEFVAAREAFHSRATPISVQSRTAAEELFRSAVERYRICL